MPKIKNQDKLTYAQKMAIIKPFVDFNYKKINHSSEKRKINKYFTAFNDMQGQAVKAYKPKDKKRLNKLKKVTGNKLKGFTAAFIPLNSPSDKLNIKFDKKGNPTIYSGEMGKKLFPFRFPDLITDTDTEVFRVLEDIKSEGFKSVSLAMGYFEFMQIFTLDDQDPENEYDEEAAAEERAEYGDNEIDGQILSLIKNLLNTYGQSDKFMRGIYGLRYSKNSDLGKYIDNKNKFRAKTATQKRKRLNLGKNNGKKKAGNRYNR